MAIEVNTKIGLISKALILLGEKPLQGLDDDRYGATVGANLFELIYENELTSNPWRFASKKAVLSQLVDVPLNQWKYAYQLPADMLAPRYVFPIGLYEIYGAHLYTDMTSVELDYTFKPEISQVPAYFAILLVYALARDMCKPITEDKEAVLIFNKEKYKPQRDRAMYADAQGRPATPVQHSPFTGVR